MFLNPILTSLIVLVLTLSLTHVTYVTYMKGGHILADLLGPATVAFAIPLYKNLHLLKKHALEMVISLIVGSAAAISTSVALSDWFHLGTRITNSLAPRSITTPIAMDVSQANGGLPVLTAVFVIVTALIGLIVGPLAIRLLPIRSSVAKGTLLGMGAHGVGTNRAFEFGSTEGTFASLAMILAAGLTLALTPILLPLVRHLS